MAVENKELLGEAPASPPPSFHPGFIPWAEQIQVPPK